LRSAPTAKRWLAARARRHRRHRESRAPGLIAKRSSRQTMTTSGKAPGAVVVEGPPLGVLDVAPRTAVHAVEAFFGALRSESRLHAPTSDAGSAYVEEQAANPEGDGAGTRTRLCGVRRQGRPRSDRQRHRGAGRRSRGRTDSSFQRCSAQALAVLSACARSAASSPRSGRPNRAYAVRVTVRTALPSASTPTPHGRD